MINIFLLLITLYQSPSDSIEFLSPSQVISQASELISEEAYEEAIALYLTVSENDTSYIQIQSKLMSTYNTLKQYDKTIEIGTRLKNEKSAYRDDIYIALGNAYLDGSNNSESKVIYQEGLDLFPYNYVLLYYMGLSYHKEENYETAVTYFRKSLLINPYYSNNHVMLGYISMLQGHITKSILSYLTSLAISPDKNNLLVFLENLANNGVRKEGSIKPFVDNSAFAYYDDLIKSKAALDDRFKSEVDFNASIVKQSELLFSKLKYVEKSGDFWMDVYVPFYAEIQKNGLTASFVYFMLTSTGNEDVIAWLEKHTKEKSAWIDIASDKLQVNRNVNEAEVLGIKDQYSFWYYNSYALSAIGNQKNADTRIGPWNFYGKNSQLIAIGKYNNQGEKTGIWKYYHENGELSRKEEFDKKGNIVTPAIYYHDNGALSIVANYENNELNGFLEYYNDCGQIKEKIPYTNGTKIGNGETYYKTGEVNLTYTMEDGELNGDYIYYYKNGNKNNYYSYKSGLLNGQYQSYYYDGQISEVGQYENDSLHGSWKRHHSNGKLNYQGTFSNGKRVGIWKYFHSNGLMYQDLVYDEDGEIDGEFKIYNTNGVLHYSNTYDHGKVIGYKYYDKHGAILQEASNSDGNMALRNMYQDGKVKAEGALKNGKLHGFYITYYKNGNIEKKGNMVQGDYHGYYEEYYATGQLYITCKYDSGLLDGYYKSYHKNGTLAQEGWYVNDQPEQVWKNYFPDGTLNDERYLISSKLNGWLNYYSPRNKIHYAHKYDMGTITGLRQYDTLGNIYHEVALEFGTGLRTRKTIAGDTIFKVNTQCGDYVSNIYNYHSSGKVSSYYTIANGIKEGEYIYYNYNNKGAIETKGNYKNDERDGKWQWFHANGKLESDYIYVDGLIHGELKSYYYNGKSELLSNYSEGKRDGASTYYDHSGNLQLIKLYNKDDGFVAYINNQTKDTIPFDNKGEFTLKTYFSNGKLAATQQFLDGKYHGGATYYNENGTKTESIEYSYGDNEGNWIAYYSNGKIYEETPYKYDLKNGISKEYYENGKIRSVKPYVNDELHGTVINYNPNGSIKNKTHFRNGYIY